MGKKVTNVFLFAAVLAAAIAMTIFVGQGATDLMIYNFVFLGMIAVIYLTGMVGGMFRINRLGEAFSQATEELSNIFKMPGKTDVKNLSCLKDIFNHTYLDQKIDSFVEGINQSEEGIGEIEEYINEEEVDLHIHKRLLEMLPDIFTSLGILGTFVGLVWGLKNFEPSDYEAMTSSVSLLVDGIKVAFLTSIYGISFSIIYTIGMKSEYSFMTEKLQAFLTRFHAYVMPKAENESMNLLVSSQKMQTQTMNHMSDKFSVQMADSFEKVITPTFQKMNESLDVLVNSVTRCQQDAVKDILDVFMKEMRTSFQIEFSDFNKALEEMTKAQKDNIAYTNVMYQTMVDQLSETYAKQEKAMKEMAADFEKMLTRFIATTARITQDNQAIQKQQQQDYQHVVDYMKESERTSAKFWVACNQAMQKYVESASNSVDKIAGSSEASGEMLKSNKRLVEEFNIKMKEYTEYQKLYGQTMEQVRRLLSDVTVAKNNKEIYLMGGGLAHASDRETLRQLQNTLREQSERQEALLEEINSNIRELSRAAQKGKFSLFK